MTSYAVELTAAALAAITEQARYIAIDGGALENRKRWLERVWDAVDSLENLPRRATKAHEDDYIAYEVRQLVVDSHLLLFTVSGGVLQRGGGERIEFRVARRAGSPAFLAYHPYDVPWCRQPPATTILVPSRLVPPGEKPEGLERV